MPAKPELRLANRTDRQVLREFHRSLYETHRDAVVARESVPLIAYRDYAKVLEDDVDSLLSDAGTYVILAEVDGVPVGYVTGRIVVDRRRLLAKRGIVEDWYVDEAHRGRGLGAMLLEDLEARFTEAGCEAIESGTWASNDGARRAHEALGYEEIRVIYRKRTP